jgi:transcriptional regulator with XRE-family HTH domain
MDADWARVGTTVRDRRLALDLTQKEAADGAGVSDTTWVALESGQRVSARTCRKAARPLQWTPESISRVLAGHDPVEVEAASDSEIAALRAEVARLTRIVEQWGTPPGAPR